MKKLFLTIIVSLFVLLLAQAQNSWSLAGNSNATSTSKLGTTNAINLRFFTNNSERMRLTSAGLLGIGTTAPTAKLHIHSTTTQDPLRVQVNGLTKLFAHRSGGLTIGSSTTPPANGLYVSGNVGIGTTNLTVPGNGGGNYKVRILHGDFGLNIENSTSGNDWELWTHVATPNSNLQLFYNGSFRGTFNAETGAYSSNSDERLKTNIKVMPSILNKVNQLKPTIYQFKSAEINTTEGSTPESYGFLAQDVRKVFPHLVTHNVNKERNLDTYSLDYSGFGVIAIKAIQELQQTNQEQLQTNEELKQIIQQQQQEINAFKDRFAKLEAVIGTARNELNNLLNTDLIGVSLEQNQPNPASAHTTFRYTIPNNANAQILVYHSATGKLVKTLQAPASGQVEMNAVNLEAGTYIYTLVVNGKQVAARQLVLSK